MFSLEMRRRIRKMLYSYVTLGVLFIIALVLVQAVWGVYQKEQTTQEKITERRARLAELKERKGWLADEIGRLENQRGVEAEIRDKFDVAKKGEQLLVIVDSQQQEQTAAAAKEHTPGLLERIAQFFGF